MLYNNTPAIFARTESALPELILRLALPSPLRRLFEPNATWMIGDVLKGAPTPQNAIGGQIATWVEDSLAATGQAPPATYAELAERKTIIDPTINRPWFTERYNNSTSASEFIAANATGCLEVFSTP